MNKAEYHRLHNWLYYNFARPTQCDFCMREDKKIEWALRKGLKYSKKIWHYIPLCRSCHLKYDMTEEKRKNMSESMKGHEVSTETKKGKPLKYLRKKVLQYSLNGRYIKTWSGACEVSRELKIGRSSIVNNLRGWSRSAGGLVWKYFK